MDSLRTLLIAAFSCSALAAPADSLPCAKVGDTVTVRGAFVEDSVGASALEVYFIPHAFPYRAFCVDYPLTAQPLFAEWLRNQYRAIGQQQPLGKYVEPKSLMHSSGIPMDKLPLGKYVEVTFTIIGPPRCPGCFTTAPLIAISKMLDIDAEVRAAIDVWMAGCQKWQQDNMSGFSSQVPGATIERIPTSRDVQNRFHIWTPIEPARCTLSATPVSKVIIPAPQPVVLVRPESR